MTDLDTRAAPGVVRFATQPPVPPPSAAPTPSPASSWAWLLSLGTRRLVMGAGGLLALGLLAALAAGRGPAGELSGAGRTTLVIFAAAVWAWVFTRIDDTYVALGAATMLVLGGVVTTDQLFATLGDDTIWLLLAAFVVAAGVTSSGLATRAAAWIVSGARSPRQLVHLVTAALVVTTFAVPSTSGRAALALPVFVALARVVTERRLVRALALLFPTVILLSAVGSLLGAGAHLVTVKVVETATGDSFDFARWLLLGVPLAVVSSHLAAELVLALFTRPQDRRAALRVRPADLEVSSPTPVTGPLTVAQSRAALLLGAVVLLWCTESLHGVHPAIVALAGALVTTSPRYGSTSLAAALASVPWSLLLFMAATLALGSALVASGAADWLASGLLGGAGRDEFVFVALVVVLSTLAHLVIQSRSARSSVLVPIVVALSPAAGVDPAAAAFASTAAAGFCHTLPSSAKPVALFSRVEGVETYDPRDLVRLSAYLAPMTAVLVLLFAYTVWPALGLSL